MIERCTRFNNARKRGKMDDDKAQPKISRRSLIAVFRTVVALAVVVALAYMIGKSWSQLRATEFRLSQVDYLDWLGAIASYFLAMLFSCFFWHRVLRAV